MSAIEHVARVLESLGSPYALIGGRAVNARGYVRATLDYDFMTTDERVLRLDLWNEIEQQGATVEPRKGDPIAGVVHIVFSPAFDVDVLMAKRESLIAEVEEHLAEVRPDVSALWDEIKRSTALE